MFIIETWVKKIEKHSLVAQGLILDGLTSE